MNSAEQCADDLRRVCKRSYIMGGPVTSKSGRTKCRNDLMDAGVWGRDHSNACKRDPEQCNHTGCADRLDRGDFADLVAEAAPDMPTNSSLAMGMVKSKMTDLQNRKNAMLGRTGGRNLGRGTRRRRTASKTKGRKRRKPQRRTRRRSITHKRR